MEPEQSTTESASETPDAAAGGEQAAPATADAVLAEDLLAGQEPEPAVPDSSLRAVVESIIYVTDQPLTADQIASGLGHPVEKIQDILAGLSAEFEKPEHGVVVREVAGGYQMATKPEHHDAVRAFAKTLKAPIKLSLAALETLAVIAYKQPVTAPEILEIRGVQGAGVVKTLLDRKLIAPAGRKNVVGKPMQYKTTREFLVQFGLKDMSELPSLKEFEEIRRMSLGDLEPAAPGASAEQPAAKPSASEDNA